MSKVRPAEGSFPGSWNGRARRIDAGGPDAGPDAEHSPHAARLTTANLGSAAFRRDHHVRFAYVAGSMYKAVSSADLVVRMGRAGLLAYFGTGGLSEKRVDSAIDHIRRTLGPSATFGMNLLASPGKPGYEDWMVDLFLRRAVTHVEAAAFILVSPALVRYRVSGLYRAPSGNVVAPNMVLAKVSRPETAEAFLGPPPPAIVSHLAETRAITTEEAQLAGHVTMADDICAEADSGGHTDQRQLVTLLPDIVRLRDRMPTPSGRKVRVGAAGGLGTPEAVAAAFVMNADFVLTGSINQCTVEGGTSDAVKDLLATAGVQDTAIVPAGDMLEIGAKAQVLRKGLLFPARANRLQELYLRYDSLDDIDPRTVEQIQQRFFRRSFDEVWRETSEHLRRTNPAELEAAERDPKLKMIHTFKWYFVHSTRLAMNGSVDQRVDYQVPCGPAMGALNTWLRGTVLESWRNRHVDDLAERLMTGAAEVLQARLDDLVDGIGSRRGDVFDQPDSVEVLEGRAV